MLRDELIRELKKYPKETDFSFDDAKNQLIATVSETKNTEKDISPTIKIWEFYKAPEGLKKLFDKEGLYVVFASVGLNSSAFDIVKILFREFDIVNIDEGTVYRCENIPLDKIGITKRTEKRLIAAGVTSFDKLKNSSKKDIGNIKGIGKKSLRELKHILVK